MNWNRAVFYQHAYTSKDVFKLAEALLESFRINFEEKHERGEFIKCNGFEIACSFYKKRPGPILKNLMKAKKK